MFIMSTLFLNATSAMAADSDALAKITNGDPIAITFFIGYMAMLASAVFFFVERGSVDPKWRISLLVSGLITGIAAVHYYYMRDFYLATGQSPTAFRYVDWTLTVPLMCVEFYLLTKPFGAKGSTLFKLILGSFAMLVFGFIGETSGIDNNIMWGVLSTLGYLYIVYEVFAWLLTCPSQCLDLRTIVVFVWPTGVHSMQLFQDRILQLRLLDLDKSQHRFSVCCNALRVRQTGYRHGCL
jgi:bacteriorhodopsin